MQQKARAFSLIELAVVLVLAGLIAGYALKMGDGSGRSECYATTKEQLEKIREAIERYAMSNDRFPMPARRYVGVDDPTYGREVALADIAQLDTKQAPNGAWAVFGALPVSTLGITMENANDCWGNKLTYVVTKDLADKTKFLDNETKGAVKINVKHGVTVLAEAGYAVISHGEDQLGAVKANWDYPTASTLTGEPGRLARKWCPVADGSLKTPNCLASTTDLISTVFNDGKDAGGNYFDDVIVYRGKPWRVGGKSNLYCWGWDNGGLANGGKTFSMLGLPKPTKIPAGVTSFSSVTTGCAVGDNAKAYCWDGSTLVPTDLSLSLAGLPASIARLDTSNAIKCVLGTDKKAYCWWAGGSPSVITTTPAGVAFDEISTGYHHMCALDINGLPYCMPYSGFGAFPPATAVDMSDLPIGTRFSKIASDMAVNMGEMVNCGLTSAGIAYCWGNDSLGQLGDGAGDSTNTRPTFASPVAMPLGVTLTSIAKSSLGRLFCGVGSDQKVYCWGSDNYGSMGGSSSSPVPVSTNDFGNATNVSVGSANGCAIDTAGDAYCWGWNFYGLLGNGTVDQSLNVYPPTKVTKPSGVTRFTSVSVGFQHACATAE